MARTKGTYSLSANIEPNAAAPLDARQRVATKADLTASGSFPYPWVGMEVYVTAEDKKYRYMGTDPTVLANWAEVGGGGSGSWTGVQLVDSNKQVTFTGLDDAHGYSLYCNNKLIPIDSVTVTGSGGNVSITYTLSSALVGDECKLLVVGD